jgi:hypothetical protein
MLAKSGEMTLGSPRDRLGENPCFQHTCTQPLAEQLQHPAIRDATLDHVEQALVVDLAEGVGDTLPTSGTFRKRCASCDPTIPSKARISSS